MDTAKDATAKTDDHAAVAAHLELLAQAKAPEVVAKSAELLVEFKTDHAADVAAYEFDCRRWGDFVTLMVNRAQRLGVRFYGYTVEIPPKTATSVNLMDSQAISLTLGHEADPFGTATFKPAVEGVDANRNHHAEDQYGRWSWPASGQWAVTPQFPRLPYTRPSVNVPQPQTKADGQSSQNWSGFGFGDRSRSTVFTMPCARPAEDDVILFANGVKLFAPAGCGQAVFDRLMAEIADGSQTRPASDGEGSKREARGRPDPKAVEKQGADHQ